MNTKLPLLKLNLPRRQLKLPRRKLLSATQARVEVRNILMLKSHPKQKLYFPDEAAADVESLMADILANGLREMIEVTPDNVIISGHRRVFALIRLANGGHPEYEELEVIVRHDLVAEGEPAVERRLIQANHNRRHLTPLEFARISKAMAALGGESTFGGAASIDEIAKQFNVSRRTLERAQALLDLPLELQREVDKKKLTRQLAQQLLSFASAEEIEALRQLAVNGGNVKQRARKLLAGRIPPHVRKPPPPAEVLERFLNASVDLYCCFADVSQLIQANLPDRAPTLLAMRRLRYAELIVPILLERVTSSSRLDAEEIEARPTLKRESLDAQIAKIAAKLKGIPAKNQPTKKLILPLVAAKPRLQLRKVPAAYAAGIEGRSFWQ